MAAEIKKADLTPHQYHLVDEMQRIRFGYIERLVIRDGQPVFVPGVTRTVRTILIERTNDPHPAAGDADTVLKAKVVKLLRHLEHVGDGLVRVLQINDGLPTRTVDVEESPADEFGFAIPGTPHPTPPPLRDIAVEEINNGDAR